MTLGSLSPARLLSFKGLTSRIPFIATALFWIAFTYVCGAFFSEASHVLNPTLAPSSGAPWLNGFELPYDLPSVTLILSFVAIAMAFVGQVALSVRRLHDIGTSGWFVVVYLYVMLAHPIPEPSNWTIAQPSITTLIWYTLLLLLPGQQRAGVWR